VPTRANNLFYFFAFIRLTQTHSLYHRGYNKDAKMLRYNTSQIRCCVAHTDNTEDEHLLMQRTSNYCIRSFSWTSLTYWKKWWFV